MTKFAARMTEAFARLGAADVGRQWSRFNVDDPTARSNGAERLVTAIWNIHTKVGAHGERVPTHPAIERDEPTGELWYRTYRIKPGDNPSSARTAHWNRLQLARTRGIPVIGILKDQVSRRLSLEDVFDVNAFAEGRDPDVLWMRLQPRGPYAGEIHPIRIAELARGVQTHPTVGSEAADPEEPLARVEADLDAIRSDQGLDATTREVLTQARVGQGRFRDQVLAAWGGSAQLRGYRFPKCFAPRTSSLGETARATPNVWIRTTG